MSCAGALSLCPASAAPGPSPAESGPGSCFSLAGGGQDASGDPAGSPALRPVLAAYYVAHHLPGRVRLRPLPGLCPAASLARRAVLECKRLFPGAEVTHSSASGSILVLHRSGGDMLGSLGMDAASAAAGSVAGGMAGSMARRVLHNPIPGKIRSWFYPRLAVFSLAVLRSLPYILNGVKALTRGRLDLDVLDASALAVCLMRRDYKSLSSITFFFALGEYLAEWTRKKSRASLAESLALNIDQVWLREGSVDRAVPLHDVRPGHQVVVRAGAAFPVDGTIVAGDGMVNQASMTGESLPVHRTVGASVYAGTIVEEGEIVVAATRVGGDTRINAILRSIEDSESVKASIQGRYERLADAIVPYNFLLSGAVYAATRDLSRAGSVLLVDYSCAIRLGTPLSIFTGMREAAEHGVLIKGGKFMEAIAEADVVVFDKTGTLTQARPRVVNVVPFGGRARADVLRLAACLEEHFVHPVGQAVVRASDEEGLKHREDHAKVEYIVAHGIVSSLGGERVLIGSGHFVLEDEGLSISPEQRAVVDAEAALGRSVLYLGVNGVLAGALFIEDELREEAPAIVQALKADGVRRVIMLTGDGEKTAASIAARAGVDEYHARMVPEHKAAFIDALKRQGHRVAMVGDGINDSPALSAAHVGVAMAEGADMAREVADIVLVRGELQGLLLARRISRQALLRVRSILKTSVFWNSVFLTGSLAGLLTPGLSALLHNATTAAIAVSSLQPVLDGQSQRGAAPLDSPAGRCPAPARGLVAISALDSRKAPASPTGSRP